MANVYYLSFAFLCLFATTAESTLQTVNGTLHITIGVTAGCSDAARFIPSQVRETYEAYKQFLEIEYVPWGRATRDAQGNPVCFFGVNDCWANRVQRCVLHLLKGNPDAQMEYMNCEYSPPQPSFRQRSLICAQNVGLSVIDVDYCLSTTGDDLGYIAEAASIQPIATINFVPFIIFNNQINVSQHAEAYRRLKSTVCFALADDPSTGVTNCRI